MQRLIIQHIEADYAVVQLADKSVIHIPRVILPPEAVAGDVLEIAVDQEEAAARKAKTLKLKKDE